jgi:hypothetical protein
MSRLKRPPTRKPNKRFSMEDRVALDEIPAAVWDARLSTVMREHRVAAYEELLLPSLLRDLKDGHPP